MVTVGGGEESYIEGNFKYLEFRLQFLLEFSTLFDTGVVARSADFEMPDISSNE